MLLFAFMLFRPLNVILHSSIYPTFEKNKEKRQPVINRSSQRKTRLTEMCALVHNSSHQGYYGLGFSRKNYKSNGIVAIFVKCLFHSQELVPLLSLQIAKKIYVTLVLSSPMVDVDHLIS